MKVQLVTPYRVSHLQRYDVTLQVCTPRKTWFLCDNYSFTMQIAGPCGHVGRLS